MIKIMCKSTRLPVPSLENWENLKASPSPKKKEREEERQQKSKCFNEWKINYHHIVLLSIGISWK